MFNYDRIDKTPTITQVIAMIKYMEEHPDMSCDFDYMMETQRPEPNKVLLNLNNANQGHTYEVIFSHDNNIISFNRTGSWVS